MTLTDKTYDVAIVGAGPAGSSSAIRLACGGMKVLLIEQKKFPRAKLCGEFISPECLDHFKELKVLDNMLTAGGVALDKTVFYARNGRSLTVPSEWFAQGSNALGLSRAAMDGALLDRARCVGVDILEETDAVDLLFYNERVCGIGVRDKDRQTFEVKATLTIDGTGRARKLSRLVDKARGNSKLRRADFVAFKTHLRNVGIPDGVCEIYGYRGGYGGSSRVENGLHNHCFIVSANLAKKYRGDAVEIMKHVVQTNRQAAQSFRDARIVDEWLAVPIESFGRAPLVSAEGLLAVGDAGAFIDPFTGSGILMALESAKISADVINSEFTRSGPGLSFRSIARQYQDRYGAKFNRRLRISSLLRRAAFVPFLAEIVVSGLSLSQGLTRRVAQATRQTETIRSSR
jgi:flavin-dependent dehydrogenase